jgi:hypothetical protein
VSHGEQRQQVPTSVPNAFGQGTRPHRFNFNTRANLNRKAQRAFIKPDSAIANNFPFNRGQAQRRFDGKRVVIAFARSQFERGDEHGGQGRHRCRGCWTSRRHRCGLCPNDGWQKARQARTRGRSIIGPSGQQRRPLHLGHAQLFDNPRHLRHTRLTQPTLIRWWSRRTKLTLGVIAVVDVKARLSDA